MPLKFTESILYLNRAATLTLTISLVSRAEIDSMSRNFPLPAGARMEPVSVALENGQTHTTISLVNPQRTIVVSYQDIIAANPAVDLSDAFIHYEAQLQIDRSQGEPLYPSDMVEIFRDVGISEEEIQRLIADEQSLRSSK
jgi:hypothetical protein